MKGIARGSKRKRKSESPPPVFLSCLYCPLFLSCLSQTRYGGGAEGGGTGGGSRVQQESVTWLKTWVPMSQSFLSAQTPIVTCAWLHDARCALHFFAHFQWYMHSWVQQSAMMSRSLPPQSSSKCAACAGLPQ
eukprot:scaffold70430_cov35-Phaeocystis_antarctica.AAC.1